MGRTPARSSAGGSRGCAWGTIRPGRVTDGGLVVCLPLRLDEVQSLHYPSIFPFLIVEILQLVPGVKDWQIND